MIPKLVLASNSPRRRQLLSLTGWTFLVRPVEIDERPLPGEAPDAYVLRLAESKARVARAHAQDHEVILTADTTVADGERILGKPEDAAAARAMLRSLRDREHTVFTAIGATDAHGDRLVTDLCAARVWMRAYSDQEIEDYIASGDPFDKAGAYAIQNPDFQPVARIEGCYACVVGLPVCHVVRTLEPFGLHPGVDVTAACPEELELNTPCPAYEQILRDKPGREPGGSNIQG